MIRYFIYFCFLFSSVANAQPTILVIGDSLSAAYGIAPEQGWVRLLQNKLQAEGYDYQVINDSISGDTTSNGLNRLPKSLETHQPAIVILELGGNDGLRGLGLSAMRDNLQEMIEQSQQADADILLLGMKIPPNYGLAYTRGFEKVFSDLAGQYDLQFIPFFLDGVGGTRRYMQLDRIHPNADGQPLMLENVWEVLEDMLEK